MTEKQDYFQSALSNVAFEAAGGGAIRHLTDLGYTVKQICGQLDFPIPYERVQKTVWEHLLDTGVLLLEEPGSGRQKARVTYVREQNKYGRTSFRQVVEKKKNEDTDMVPVSWTDKCFDAKTDFYADLAKRCSVNGEEASYVSCDFGLRSKRAPEQFENMIRVLDETERDYLLGLPWEAKMCYHRLNERMRRITVKLYESSGYHGICYFIKTHEKIRF